MLHRAGNVDGEGDGCGVLVDIPRKIWAEEVRAGGHNPSLVLDDGFASPTSSSSAPRTSRRSSTTLASCSAAGGFRILAERLGEVDSQALGATAREEEPHFWQIGGLVADPARSRARSSS